jgi:transcriptional regulator with XRE-family HTH domain
MVSAVFLNRPASPLLAAARLALGVTQEELGEALGASQRTVQRWEAGSSSPSPDTMCDLARRVYPVDAGLAAQIAGSAGESLGSLGLAATDPAGGASKDVVRDAILCVAADAMNVAPAVARAGLAAAFVRARALGVAAAELEALVTPVAKPAS